MSFSSELKEELLKIKMWDVSARMSEEEQLQRLCVREAFIKSGFVNEPSKDYHLEILFKSKKKAEEIKNILTGFDINTKIIVKNKDYMIYLKDGEEISNFLALIGASNSVVKFEEVRVIKETKNNINRVINCETANLSKTINAALIQIEDIKLLRRKNKFKDLTESLQELAVLREENPDMSLDGLGKMLKTPIGKSGVNHRFKKIHEISDTLRK
jgi:DNA-binding protein WhiA